MIFKKRPKPVDLEQLDQLEPMLESGLPILLDFWRQGCQACRLMDGIVKELAEDYEGSAHIVRIDVGRVGGAADRYRIQATPTFIVLGRSQKKPSKKSRQQKTAEAPNLTMTPRWRTSGMTRKDMLAGALESNGARRATG